MNSQFRSEAQAREAADAFYRQAAASATGASGSSAEEVRGRIRAMKAPKSGERGETFSYGGKSVTISKGRPGWSSTGNTSRSIYWARYDDGTVSNSMDFSGKGGFEKAKRWAISYLRLGE